MKPMRGGKRKAIIILNGLSLKKKIFYHEYLPPISQMFDVEVHETLSKNDAKTLASKFTDKYVDLIIAAGGDGTLHQVVNGVLKGRETEKKLPTLGVIPVGSGNDFSRGVELYKNLDRIIRKLSDFNARATDVGVIEFQQLPGELSETSSVYFINVADIGMGPEVVKKVQSSGRPYGRAAAYYTSILSTFLTYRPMVVKAVTKDWTWEGKLRTLGVANGRYYGHGLCIAPEAALDDRVFSVFICGDVSIFDFIRQSGKLRKGKRLTRDKIFYKTTSEIELSSAFPCQIEGDGEILGWLPAKVKVFERQLNFLI